MAKEIPFAQTLGVSDCWMGIFHLSNVITQDCFAAASAQPAPLTVEYNRQVSARSSRSSGSIQTVTVQQLANLNPSRS